MEDEMEKYSTISLARIGPPNIRMSNNMTRKWYSFYFHHIPKNWRDRPKLPAHLLSIKGKKALGINQ
jgi:hypothetical protein